MLALVLLGAAFARPVSRGGGAALARVVIVDRSRGALPDVRDSARTLLHPGDAIVIADSSARQVRDGAADSARVLQTNGSVGSLSAALVAARRAARALSDRADSVELVIVSPFASEEFDAATVPLAGAWPGRVRAVRSRLAPASPRTEARLVTATLTAADSQAAQAGGAVVHWPSSPVASVAARGVWIRGTTLVALLGRRTVDTTGMAIARWADGTAAVTERPLGRGCIRDVGIGVPPSGDLTLRPAFVRLRSAITRGCGATASAEAAADSLVRALGREGAAAPARLLSSDEESSPVALWLLTAAIIALVGEWLLRRRSGATA
jgi:hypothetical protein